MCMGTRSKTRPTLTRAQLLLVENPNLQQRKEPPFQQQAGLAGFTEKAAMTRVGVYDA